jgi:hypothetical protein
MHLPRVRAAPGGPRGTGRRSLSSRYIRTSMVKAARSLGGLHRVALAGPAYPRLRKPSAPLPAIDSSESFDFI